MNDSINSGQGFWSDAESYNKVTGLPVISAIRAITAKVIREELSRKDKIKVLSLGIGSGALFTEFFLEEIRCGQIELLGLDILDTMISLCKEKLPFANVTLETGDINKLSEFFSEQFDVIEAGLVLHHVLRYSDLTNTLSVIQNKLNNDGLFILGDIDVECGEYVESKLDALEKIHGALSIDLQSGEFFNGFHRVPILTETNLEDVEMLSVLDKTTCSPLLQEVENLDSQTKDKLLPLILQNVESAKKGLEWHRSIDSSKGWLQIFKDTFGESREPKVFRPQEIRANFPKVLDNPFVLVIK